MRPIASFTLHAILAAALVAFATTSAAAEGRRVIDNEGYVYLSGRLLGGPAASQGERLGIAALRWGTVEDSANLGSWTKVDGLDVSWDVPEARVNKVDGFAVKQKTVEGGGANQISMDDTAGREKLRPGANETITIGSNRTESGLPTGKRQHKPFLLDRPTGKGSVWIRVSSPWVGCRVGQRYPSLELGSAGQAYLLRDAVVAGCSRARDMVAFDYAGVSVRGWNPKAKQEVTGKAEAR